MNLVFPLAETSPWVLGFVFMASLMLGSFINVVGLRLLKDEEFVVKRSYCYGCQNQLSWRELIPVLSWLMQQGKCKSCNAPISAQYPTVELATALLFTATIAVFGLSLKGLLLCWLFGNLMVILITDFREQYIFDVNSIGLIPAGFVYGFVRVFEGGFTWIETGLMIWHAAIAIGISWLIFKLLNLFSNALFKVDGFGEGDVRLLMGIGAFFGLKAVVMIFLGSFVLQMVLTLPMLCWQWLVQGRVRILGLFAGSVVVSALPYAFFQLPYLPKVILTLGCAAVALFMAFKAVRLSQTHPTGLTYMPFGPAICAACVVWVFAQTAGLV